jgi:hypothetical protein
MRRFDMRDLQAIWEAPLDPTARATWYGGAKDSVQFLKSNATQEEVVLYAHGPSVLVHGVLAKTSKVSPADHDDLMHDFIDLEASWCIERSYGGGQGHRIYLESPLRSHRSKALIGGEKLVFRRKFIGVDEGPVPVEISQRLVHALSLYYVAERSAFCRLDGNGDIEDVIRIIRPRDPASSYSAVITILAKELNEYMAVTETSLVFFFDFTRVPKSFMGWDELNREDCRAPDLFYHTGDSVGASYCNGRMICRPTVALQDMIDDWKRELDGSDRQYATFKIYDRKNDLNIETPCSPEHLSNYFQKSDLPWEISPAFFRAEVLHRFKSDPEKFSMDDRSISCRNAWYLKSYDINEEGQVHAYIGDLAKLPYEEQIYWKSFNEWPKGSISKRAHQTDILGEFTTEYEPLNSIKRKVKLLDDTAPAWWKPRYEKLADAARSPATDSVLEWGNEILALDQYLVEGFLDKPLRTLVESKGGKPDPNWKSLRLLQAYFEAIGQTPAAAEGIVAPLKTLHNLRTPLRGHASSSTKRAAETDARAIFGTLRAHYTDLAGKCDKALDIILEALGIYDPYREDAV